MKDKAYRQDQMLIIQNDDCLDNFHREWPFSFIVFAQKI